MKRKNLWAVIAIAMSLFLASCYTGDKAVSELGTVRLNIETYRAGNNQPTHPSVITFPEEWNGAKYWLAYSPYPNANGEEENPCLAISNDMLFWMTPYGLANPIADNEETGCDELKDPHLVYREDLDRLEMWYLGRVAEHLGGDGQSLLLLRKYSYDGVNWSEYEVMTSVKYLSPTVIWNGSKYQMWSIGYDLWGTTGTVVYQESTDGIIWTEATQCVLGENEEGIDIWHGSVSKYNNQYYFVYVDMTDKQEVFYCSSADGIHFSDPEIIIENQGFWDYLYRPFLAFYEDSMACIYGVVNQDNQWYLSMSRGSEVHNLIGIDEQDVPFMQSLSDEPTDTHNIWYHVRNTYNLIQDYLRIELVAMLIIESPILCLLRKKRRIKPVLICSIVNIGISLMYILIRLHPYDVYSWCAAVVALGVLNVGMSSVLQCIVQFGGKGNLYEKPT